MTRVVGWELIDNLPRDVAEFWGMGTEVSVNVVLDRCYECTMQLVSQWNSRPPRTAAEMLDYYRRCTGFYVGDLVCWHYRDSGRREWFERQTCVLTSLGVETVLDYGAGIGSDGLFLAANGFQVTLADFGGPSLEFALWRVRKYGLEESVRVVTLPSEIGAFDNVILIDVLEHIPDYQKLLGELCRKSWLLTISAPFRDRRHPNADLVHPQHLFDSTEVPLESFLASQGLHSFDGMFWVKNSIWHHLHAIRELIKKGRLSQQSEGDKSQGGGRGKS